MRREQKEKTIRSTHTTTKQKMNNKNKNKKHNKMNGNIFIHFNKQWTGQVNDIFNHFDDSKNCE